MSNEQKNDDLFKMMDNNVLTDEQADELQRKINEEQKAKIEIEYELSFFEQMLQYKKKFIITGIINLIIFILFMVFKGYNKFITYCDSTFVIAVIDLSIGGLATLSSFGAYNIFSYSASYIVKRIKNEHIDSYYDYQELKKEKRSKYKLAYLPYIFWGIVVLIVAIILQIILINF